MCWSQALTAFGASSLEHETAILAGHTRAKTVRLRPSSVVGLKSALRHSDESPYKTKTLRLIGVRIYVKKSTGVFADFFYFLERFPYVNDTPKRRVEPC